MLSAVALETEGTESGGLGIIIIVFFGYAQAERCDWYVYTSTLRQKPRFFFLLSFFLPVILGAKGNLFFFLLFVG